MNLWLDKTVELINRSGLDLSKVKYESILILFHDHLSNRNLSILLASLYELSENDIYFEIDKIIKDETNYDMNEISQVKNLLDTNNFQEWIESDEF